MAMSEPTPSRNEFGECTATFLDSFTTVEKYARFLEVGCRLGDVTLCRSLRTELISRCRDFKKRHERDFTCRALDTTVGILVHLRAESIHRICNHHSAEVRIADSSEGISAPIDLPTCEQATSSIDARADALALAKKELERIDREEKAIFEELRRLEADLTENRISAAELDLALEALRLRSNGLRYRRFRANQLQECAREIPPPP